MEVTRERLIEWITEELFTPGYDGRYPDEVVDDAFQACGHGGPEFVRQLHSLFRDIMTGFDHY